MPNLTLTNTASASGVYDGAPISLAALQAVTVVLVDGLTMTISADKTRWADMNPLTYTITITNNSSEEFSLDESGVIALSTNTFDPTAVIVDTASVLVAGNQAQNINFTAGVLSLELTQPIAADGGNAVIMFQVTKIPQ